jgi:hypothetical protein
MSDDFCAPKCEDVLECIRSVKDELGIRVMSCRHKFFSFV